MHSDDPEVHGVRLAQLLYSEQETLKYFGTTRTKFREGVLKGIYPAPVQVGPRRVAWRERDFQIFEDKQPMLCSSDYPDDQLPMDEKATIKILGISRSGLRAGIKEGIYPAFHEIAPHYVVWYYRDLEKFVNNLRFVQWRGMRNIMIDTTKGCRTGSSTNEPPFESLQTSSESTGERNEELPRLIAAESGHPPPAGDGMALLKTSKNKPSC